MVDDRISAIDKERARRNFGRAAETYDAAAVLQLEIANRLIAKMDVVRLEPTMILDAGAGTGLGIDLLQRRFPGAKLTALDFALPMLHKARRRGGWFRRPGCICADLEHLPLATASVDLLFSNLALQWVNDLPTVFDEALRVLRPGGLLLFTSFGPDTLKELRAAWTAVDGHAHVSTFLDMHDVGDMLVRAQFADPVLDVDRLTLTYPDLRGLMKDLKAIGAANASGGRQRSMTGKGRMQALTRAYDAFRDDAGLLPATYEVVYGHCWAPEQRRVGGETRIPITAIRGQGRQAR